MVRFSSFIFLLLLIGVGVTRLEAAPPSSSSKSESIHPEFRTPQRLRGRVDFWKDVFATYNRYQIIIHHRDFPQVRFGLVDLVNEARGMSDVQYDVFKKKRVEAAMDEVRAIFRALSDGRTPRTEQEKFIAGKMVIVPGGTGKYALALENDLIRSQTGMREKFAEAIQRSGRYMQIMEQVFVHEYGLPKELTRLPFVESSFNYEAYSTVGAAGIWQFMPGTAKHYSMMVNSIVDERRDPLESTVAAARYFSHAYNKLGTWPLAVISYNHGVAGVLKKIRAENNTDLAAMIERPFNKRPFGFASSNFYPSLLASIEVYKDRRTLFPDVREEPALQLTKVRLSKKTSIAEVSKRLGVSRDTLRRSNYALSDAVWQGRALIPAGYVLKVPQRFEERVEVLAQNMEAAPVVPETMKAKAKSEIKTLPKSSTQGSKQKVIPAKPAPKTKVVTKARPPVAKKQAKQPLSTVYKAKAGDSLWSIARQKKIDFNELVKLNSNLRKGVKPGQTVILPK